MLNKTHYLCLEVTWCFVFFLLTYKHYLPPMSSMMPPATAMRALRTLLSSPHVVHFIPTQATPSPAIDTMMPTIIRARVAWREPNTQTVDFNKEKHLLYHSNIYQEPNIDHGGSMVQHIYLLPHSSRVPGLILSSSYCLCFSCSSCWSHIRVV